MDNPFLLQKIIGMDLIRRTQSATFPKGEGKKIGEAYASPKFLKNSSCADVARTPVTTVQGINCNATAGRCIDEGSIAEIDTNMGCTIIVCGEEYQITWNQLTTGYRHTNFILGICRAWKIDSCAGKHITHIAGAVKTARARATKYIRHTDVIHGIGNDTTGHRVKATTNLWHFSAHQS